MAPSSAYCPKCGAQNTSGATACALCGEALSAPAPSPSAAPATTSDPTSGMLQPQHLLQQHYRILRRLGAGGFGAVYQAEDTRENNQLVAIKEMSHAGLSPQDLQEATEAFHHEAQLLTELSHLHLPRIHAHFQEGGNWYLVMDFIAGETLEEHLIRRGGRLPVKEVLKLGIKLCKVLHYLHTRQPPVIFRDLKPGNVMLTPDGKVFLIDFGIARHFKPGKAHDTIAFGSPGYAAPEQYGTAQTTPRSDIYSLGALLHQMLTGDDPENNPFQFAPLRVPVPDGLEKLIQQMVELDPHKRPTSMAAIEYRLEHMTDAWAHHHQAGVQAPPAPVLQPVAQPRRRLLGPRSALFLARVLVLIVLGIVILLVVLFLRLPHRPASSCPPPSAAATVQAPVSIRALSVAWSPNGQRVLSASQNGGVQTWDAQTGSNVLTYEIQP